MWYWQKNGQTDLCSRVECRNRLTEINWSWTKEQRQFNVEKVGFSTSNAKATGQLHAKKIQRFYTLHKNSHKMDHKVSVKCKTLKLLRDKIGQHLGNLGFSVYYLAMIQKAQSMKEKSCWIGLDSN